MFRIRFYIFVYIFFFCSISNCQLNKKSIPLIGSGSDIPPDSWDWRTKGVVSPVKNQGTCTACWAFSSVACIESQIAISQGTQILLSEQFLVDCIHFGKSDQPKCDGNFTMLRTFGEIVSEIGGVLAEGDYRPYDGISRRCTFKGGPPYPMTVIGFVRVAADENIMAIYLAKYGPLSAAINSASMNVYPAGSGIDEPTDAKCPSDRKQLNHAILIVGYNVFVDKGRVVPYWVIKNSWGTKWGDEGYYYLVRGRNACGIANEVSLALVP